MEPGVIIAIISGLLLILLGLGLGLYFLLTEDTGGGGDDGPPKQKPEKPGPPRNITYTYLI